MGVDGNRQFNMSEEFIGDLNYFLYADSDATSFR